MTDQELIRQADNLRAEAGRLLYDDGLLALIEAIGPTSVIGSYDLNLMAWPDIDISFQLPDEKNVAVFFDLGKKIACKFNPFKMGFDNIFLRDDLDYRKGLYWGVRLNHGNKAWKVDIWGFGADVYQEAMQSFDELRSMLQDADRMAILRIKSEFCQRPEYRKEVTSLDIYEAVARHNVRTTVEFDEWLIKR